MYYYPYKIHHTQELLDRDEPQRFTLAIHCLSRMSDDLSFPCNILWSDEAHFYLKGTLNTQNYSIWAMENPWMRNKIPLHSPKVTVWCGFTVTFILRPFFFEEITTHSPTTCSVMGCWYHVCCWRSMYRNYSKGGSLPFSCKMVMPSHVHESVEVLLLQHFTDERVISRFLVNSRPLRSPEQSPYNFRL